MKINRLFFLLSIILFTTLLESCVPPRCRIPNCAILVDHVHRQYGREIPIVEQGVRPTKKKKTGKKATKGDNLTGQETQGKKALSESPDRWYRGLPWYMFMFRKKQQAENIAGFYRAIDEKEVQRFRRPADFQVSQKEYNKYNKYQTKKDSKRLKRNEKLLAAAEKEEERLAKEEEKEQAKKAKQSYDDGVEVVDDTEEGKEKKKKKEKKEKGDETESEEIKVED